MLYYLYPLDKNSEVVFQRWRFDGRLDSKISQDEPGFALKDAATRNAITIKAYSTQQAFSIL